MTKVLCTILFLLLLSCDKPQERIIFCWHCEIYTIGGVIIKLEVDNLTYEEIMIYKQGLNDGIEYFIKGHVTTVCVKK